MRICQRGAAGLGESKTHLRLGAAGALGGGVLAELEAFGDLAAAPGFDEEGEEGDHAGDDGGEPGDWLPAGFDAEVDRGDEISHVGPAVDDGDDGGPAGQFHFEDVLHDHAGAQQEQHHTGDPGGDGEDL